jgi:Ca-activated chloride channel family protein
MRLRNSLTGVLTLVVALTAAAGVWAQTAQNPPVQPPAQQEESREVTAEELMGPLTPEAAPEPDVPANVPNQPGNTVNVPAGGSRDAEVRGKEFIFRANVEEVTLHATVVDDRQRLVTTLDKNAFQVFEDGQPQQIKTFRREDIPVSLGILIDSSGSMRDKRPAVNAAALNLVRASNPQDEVFIVNFSDEYYLDQDFTADLNLLKEGLERIDSRGGTSLYDAVIASADHLEKFGKKGKKILLVVTDGEDNASRTSLEAAIRRLQDEEGPTVYTITILGEEKARRAKRAMQQLALNTGGIAFFPEGVSEVDRISQQIARDIRNQYVIGYQPKRPRTDGGYRSVKVEAQAKGFRRLQVRTRSGYFPGQERAENR